MKPLIKILLLSAPLALQTGCPPSLLVPIAPSAAKEQRDPSALEILCRSAVADPLPLRHSKVAYSGLNQALTQEIAAAAQPWVERHRERGQHSDGWQLLLAVTDAQSTYQKGHATVALALRATLRTRVGNQHLAQTQTHCQQTAAVTQTQASVVFEACLHDLRTELSRWLNGVNP